MPDAPEVMEVLKDSLSNLTAAHGAAQMARVVREIVNPEPEPQPDTLDSIIKAKQAGLIGNQDGGAFGATAQLMTAMLAEQGKAASDARSENKQLTESMIGMIVDNMQNQNKAAMDEIAKRLDMTNNDPFQTAVKQAMAAMLMRSLGDITNPRSAQQQAAQSSKRGIGDLVEEIKEMESVYTHLSGFFNRREESIDSDAMKSLRNPYMNPEILRATLEDDRERLRMQIEQKRLEEQDRARRETMDKADKIISGIAPLIAQALAAKQMPIQGMGQSPMSQPIQQPQYNGPEEEVFPI